MSANFLEPHTNESPQLESRQSRILTVVRQAGLKFPGFDDTAILDRLVPSAENWILMKIVSGHLSIEDQKLFRDAQMSAPDIFDPVEFLSDILPEYDALVETYFEAWIADFQKNLAGQA
jgi:hypothetical protein